MIQFGAAEGYIPSWRLANVFLAEPCECHGGRSPRNQANDTTGEKEPVIFVASLDGPVVIQSFAVWCPKCERQSKNLQNLDDSVTVVSLNTDPNEDAAKVKEHAESKGFGWRFAVSPTELADALIDAFGSGVTVAPSTPIIVACEGGDAEFTSGSILSAQEIQSTASDC